MTTFGDMVYSMGVPVVGSFGNVGLNGGKIIFLDPSGGLDGNDGTSPASAVKTLAVAYALTTDGANDTVVILGTSTAVSAGSGLLWSNSYTHLVGATPPLACGQRARITGNTTLDPTYLITFSGAGCSCRNVQFFNGADANAASGAVIVSGDRFYAENCQFSGMGHATAGAHANGFSLKLYGASEGTYVNCYIGLDTIVRTTNSELILVSNASGDKPARNTFRECAFASYSETGAHTLVNITNADRWTRFIDCDFYNFSVNFANKITNAFTDTETTTHSVDFRRCSLNPRGITGWADTVTSFYSSDPQPNAGWGIGIAPTT